MRAFFEGAPEISKNVPMPIGSVSAEDNRMCSRPTEAEWTATLAKSYGDAKAAAIVSALKRAYPSKSIRTLSYNVQRSRAEWPRPAEQRHAHGHDEARAEGRARVRVVLHVAVAVLEDAGAWHTAELAFCFDNTARCAQGTGNGPEAQALAKKMATAWANFARTGNPSAPGLPWPAFSPDRCPTMVFDNDCRMVDDAEARKLLLS